MARIRSVKPALRTSRVVASWPWPVRYFWVLLWGYLDDYGRGLDLPRAIAADCFPLDDDVTPAKVDRWLTTIAETKIGTREPPLCRYEVDDARYIHAVNWKEHQRPNRPSPSVHPRCPVHESFTESGSEPPLSPRVLEGEGEREIGGGGALTEAPSPWCASHPGGTTAKCVPCRDARLAAERWRAEQRERLAAMPRCEQHPTEPADHCGPCAGERKGAA